MYFLTQNNKIMSYNRSDLVQIKIFSLSRFENFSASNYTIILKQTDNSLPIVLRARLYSTHRSGMERVGGARRFPCPAMTVISMRRHIDPTPAPALDPTCNSAKTS